jgi:pyruvate formate lyase activating enzyme
MNLPIKGFQKSSMIDFPGKMCSIVFVADCNFRCPYCHNPDLILKTELPVIDQNLIFEYLESKSKWIDGVCITGGEPTIHQALPEFCKKVKSSGFLVKVDTNGTNPEMLGNLVKEKIIDFIAMDVKGPLERYEEIVRVPVNKNDIQRSIDIIRKSGLDYEFRTTVAPKLLKEQDLLSMGKWLRGSKMYVLQQFRAMVEKWLLK